MKNFFSTAWKATTAPFRFIIWLIIRLPYRGFKQVKNFFTDEPEEQPLVDVFTSTIQSKDAREELWSHINVLRMHLLRILLGLSTTAVISFSFAYRLLVYLAKPLPEGFESLTAIEMTEPFSLYLKIALLSGFVAALPYIAFELYLFIAPGLRSRARLMGLVAIPLAFVLFISGMAFAFYVMLPAAVPILLRFVDINIQPQAKSYYDLALGMMFWIGIAFEFPLIAFILTAIGVLNPKAILDQWRIAIVLCAILAAAITPTVDPFNMGIVMVPMFILYIISIGFSYLAYRGKNRKQ
ncbi:MAG: twin-arginine translocase subunit TatC [Anaerolineales bacterium]|nr:twin-arginine translocase subunit TatC [Anaerolineales bacterium]